MFMLVGDKEAWVKNIEDRAFILTVKGSIYLNFFLCVVVEVWKWGAVRF